MIRHARDTDHPGPARAVVVGAGPGGSVAALLLAAHRLAGHRCSSASPSRPRWAPGSCSSRTDSRSCTASVSATRSGRSAHEIRGAAIRNHHGRVLLRTAGARPRRRARPPARAAAQSHLADRARRRGRGGAGVELHAGAEVERGHARRHRHVPDRRRRAHASTAELVVAADGVRSRVRDTAGFAATTLQATAHTYLRAIVDSPTARTTSDEQAEHWTPLGLFGSHHRSATAPPTSSPTPTRRRCGRALDARRHRCAPRRVVVGRSRPPTPLFAELASVDDLLVNQVQRVDAPSFRSGRVALLGDAAHAMAPNLGQGANSALVDAAALALELAAHPDVDAALDAYDARRRPAVRKVQRDADRVWPGPRDSATASPAGCATCSIARTPASASERRFRAVQQEDPATLLPLGDRAGCSRRLTARALRLASGRRLARALFRDDGGGCCRWPRSAPVSHCGGSAAGCGLCPDFLGFRLTSVRLFGRMTSMSFGSDRGTHDGFCDPLGDLRTAFEAVRDLDPAGMVDARAEGPTCCASRGSAAGEDADVRGLGARTRCAARSGSRTATSTRSVGSRWKTGISRSELRKWCASPSCASCCPRPVQAWRDGTIATTAVELIAAARVPGCDEELVAMEAEFLDCRPAR